MTKSENIFVCIGAIHQDYLINLKKNIINYRSNPIIHKTRIGGVAYNVAEIISIFQKIQFYSLAINKELKIKISKNIIINQIDNNLSDRYYIALSDKKNKFLLGLANTDVYESNNFLKIPNISNKFIIFDLNFSKIYLEKAIRKLSYKNKIIVCATSVYKIIKIKKIVKNIDIIFLNKAELIQLTNSSNILTGIKKKGYTEPTPIQEQAIPIILQGRDFVVLLLEQEVLKRGEVHSLLDFRTLEALDPSCGLLKIRADVADLRKDSLPQTS